jgi:hypothetical protein
LVYETGAFRFNNHIDAAETFHDFMIINMFSRNRRRWQKITTRTGRLSVISEETPEDPNLRILQLPKQSLRKLASPTGIPSTCTQAAV